MFPIHLFKNKQDPPPKHFDTVINSIHTSPFPITNTISNTHNNLRPQVDFFATNLSKSSRVDQDFFLIKLVINMTSQHHILWIQFFF